MRVVSIYDLHSLNYDLVLKIMLHRSYDVMIYEVIAGHKNIKSITPHRIEIEMRSKCRCVCLVKTHRLIRRYALSGSFVRSGHLT